MMNRGLIVFAARPLKLLREGWEELEVKLCTSKALCGECLLSRSYIVSAGWTMTKRYERDLKLGVPDRI